MCLKCRKVIWRILSNSKGLKQITGIRASGKVHNITHVRNANGEMVHGRQEFADVFVDFYAQLYASLRSDRRCEDHREWHCEPASPFSSKEVEDALKKMAQRKAGDSQGVVVEMLQQGGKKLMDQIAQLSTDVLDPEGAPSRVLAKHPDGVLFKKGERYEPENYRPVAILPILYKVFAKLLDQRIGQVLERAQAVDQAGFRAGFSCSDHLSV